MDTSTSPRGVDRFATVSLADLQSQAALLDRRDRKYLLDLEELTRFLAALPADTTVLEHEQRRIFGYRSVYFDTAERTSYRLAAQDRPQRWKARVRTYRETGECWLEVKQRDRSGRTTKHRWERSSDEPILTARELTCVDGIVARVPGLRTTADQLRPVLTTTYDRLTLLVGDARVTVDIDVRCAVPDGRDVTMGLAAIVETKSPDRAGPADRVLWSLGHRPAPISKYATGLAALDPRLPANRWARTLRRCALRPMLVADTIGTP